MSGTEYTPPELPSLAAGPEVEAPTSPPQPPTSFSIDSESSELLADLIESTSLAPLDRLALVRGRTRQGQAFVDALVAEGLASSDGVARILAARHGLPLVDVHLSGVSAEASMQIPLHVLGRVVALPYRLEGETLHVALADPQNVQAIDELRLATRYRLSLGVAPRDDILAHLDRMGRVSDAVVEAVDDGDIEGSAIADLEEEDGVSDGPVVRMVNSIMLQAAEDGASDVHFEAQEDGLVVRYRVDGVLHEMQRIPKRLAPGVTTRVKVLAKLDIAERRRPQDGRMSLRAASAGGCSTSVSRPCPRSPARRSSCACSTSRRSHRRSRSSVCRLRCRPR